MTEQIKTVRMPQAIWDGWEEAMLSGRYNQTAGTMCDSKGFCCLGLLQMSVDGQVERVSPEDILELNSPMFPVKEGDFGMVPSQEWLAKHGITFEGVEHSTDGRSPYIPTPGGAIAALVTELNDEGHSFAEIAKALKPHVETY